MVYGEAFKASMVERLSGVGAKSAGALSREVGVSQATLSRWLIEAGTLGPVKKKKRSAGSAAPKQRSSAEKIRILLAVSALEGEERGALLRREGVHEAELTEWRAMIEEALDGSPANSRAAARDRADDRREIQDLKKEIRRKDKALAETAALLVLQKKVRAIWGAEDDGTDDESGK